MARAVFLQREFRKIKYTQVLVLEISESGARFRSAFVDLPQHLYIVLGNYEHFIGASIVERKNGEFAVRFIKEQPTRFVNALSRVQEPLATLHDLRTALGVRHMDD